MATPWTCPACRQKAQDAHAGLQSDPLEVGPRHRASLETHRCRNPDCGETTLDALIFETGGPGAPLSERGASLVRKWQLVPAKRSRTWPSFVPAAIRADYEEACEIELLSPRASAALARRCLRTLLHDFFSASDASLALEIERVERGVAEETTLVALRSIRDLANVRAASDRDPSAIVEVADGEAALMLESLELLIEETYVARHERGERLTRFKKLVAPRLLPANGATKPGREARSAIRRYLNDAFERIQVLRQR